MARKSTAKYLCKCGKSTKSRHRKKSAANKSCPAKRRGGKKPCRVVTKK